MERYGLPIPFDLLGPLYHETQESDVLRIMAMQGHPQATELIMPQHAAGKAGGSYFFLAYTDTKGTVADRATNEITQAKGAEFTCLAIYHTRVMNDDRYLREVLALLESDVSAPDDAVRDRRYDSEAFWLVINVKSEVIRDYLRRRITQMAPDSATYALASLYAVHRDYAFIDALLGAELAKEEVTAFHSRIFWRIVARRSAQNNDLATLVERHASSEIKHTYFGPDSWFVDDYWVGNRISYRPLAERH